MEKTLPLWMTLQQASDWLSSAFSKTDVEWSVDKLLGALTTYVGPMSTLRGQLPVWVSTPKPLLIRLPGKNDPVQVPGGYAQLSQESVEKFCIHDSIECDLLAVQMEVAGRIEELSVVPGLAIERKWLVVRGHELLRFVRFYCDVCRSKTTASKADLAESKSGPWWHKFQPQDKARAVCEKMHSTGDYVSKGKDKGKISLSKLSATVASQIVEEANKNNSGHRATLSGKTISEYLKKEKFTTANKNSS